MKALFVIKVDAAYLFRTPRELTRTGKSFQLDPYPPGLHGRFERYIVTSGSGIEVLGIFEIVTVSTN